MKFGATHNAFDYVLTVFTIALCLSTEELARDDFLGRLWESQRKIKEEVRELLEISLVYVSSQRVKKYSTILVAFPPAPVLEYILTT